MSVLIFFIELNYPFPFCQDSIKHPIYRPSESHILHSIKINFLINIKTEYLKVILTKANNKGSLHILPAHLITLWLHSTTLTSWDDETWPRHNVRITCCHYNDSLCVYVWLTEASASLVVVCCGSLISQQEEPREENQKGLHEGCDPLDTHRWCSWKIVARWLNANTSTLRAFKS